MQCLCKIALGKFDYGALKSVLPTANKIGYGRRWKYVSVYMPVAHVYASLPPAAHFCDGFLTCGFVILIGIVLRRHLLSI